MLKKIKEKIEKFKKRKKLIDDLIERRDEVVHRITCLARKQIPDWLLESPFADVLLWIINPHVLFNWKHYEPVSDISERKALNITQQIMTEAKRVESEENK